MQATSSTSRAHWAPDRHRDLVPGGVGPQTTQTLHNIATILAACGATLDDVVKINVFLADIDTFAEMNDAYLAVMGAPHVPGQPARASPSAALAWAPPSKSARSRTKSSSHRCTTDERG
ncbi:MAG: RidA family protein [Caldilineaceae bacterium]